ncbi:DUF3618 domain-containing protein [Georgenia halophila]|uniref:DUF3618 domain-containing protein n=1 Tax=Georgenia halophila TaxID=620889 RepID=A0ABP8LHE6_9MICO
MTTNDPDQIRADIERTRAELSDDVDALGEKSSPSRMAERQTEKVKDAATGAKERVFGAAEDAKENLSETMSGTGDKAKESPQRARRKAEGNPLAAGVIAFGVGLLASSLVPSSRKEREMVQQAKGSDQVQRATQEVKDTAKETADHLREPAQQATQDVRETATSGAQEVKDTARSGAEGVRSEGQQARDDVAGRTQESKERMRDARNGS